MPSCVAIWAIQHGDVRVHGTVIDTREDMAVRINHGDLCITTSFARSLRQALTRSLRQAQILILEILHIFLRLTIFAFLELEQNWRFFKGLMWLRYISSGIFGDAFAVAVIPIIMSNSVLLGVNGIDHHSDWVRINLLQYLQPFSCRSS